MDNQIVNLTGAAAARLATLEAKGGGKVVRLSVRSSGCSGHKYSLDYADAPGKHDEVVRRDGATLYVDPLSLLYVAGTTVGWKEDKLERAFTFDNPNETGRCGCGESFAA